MANSIIPGQGVLVGRARVPGYSYPRVITVRGGEVLDITSHNGATVRDVCEMHDPADYVAHTDGVAIGSVHALLANSWEGKTDHNAASLLSPIDLQAVKAAGVTFVVSLLERVIEEQARGDKAKADALRRTSWG